MLLAIRSLNRVGSLLNSSCGVGDIVLYRFEIVMAGKWSSAAFKSIRRRDVDCEKKKDQHQNHQIGFEGVHRTVPRMFWQSRHCYRSNLLSRDGVGSDIHHSGMYVFSSLCSVPTGQCEEPYLRIDGT